MFDTVAYGPGALFAEMRLALAAERVRTNAAEIGRGEMPTEPQSGHVALLESATRGGAAVLGLGDAVGASAVGLHADLITVDLTGPHLDSYDDPVLATFLGAGPADVDTVVVAGRVRKRDGHVDRSLLATARELVRESRARIRARTR